VPCARAGAWHARDEMQGHNGVLLYAQQRWLDPGTGRFLSLDPVAGSLSDPLSTQGFTYTHANPTRFTDPTGEFVFVPVAVMAAIKLVAIVTATTAVAGAVVGAASTAYVNENASAEDVLRGAGDGALNGAGVGLLVGTAVVALPAAAVALGGTASAATVGTGVAVVGTAGSAIDAGAKQYIARTGEFRDEGLVREANVAGVATALGAATFGLVKAGSAVNASLDAAISGAVDAGLSSASGDAALATFGQAPPSPLPAPLRTATAMPRGNAGSVLADGAGATAAEMQASVGGPTGGLRGAAQQQARAAALAAEAEAQGTDTPTYTCWRCGTQTMNPDNMHIGHRNVPRADGGNLEPVNVCLEGAACNLSAGNRGAPTPGRSCADRGSCGAPYGRTD
jgi:RHS repeat-associated protein